MDFKLQATDTNGTARAGLITTDHGQIETPIFMPVGTVGSVKGVHMRELRDDIKAQIILAIHTICICVQAPRYCAKRRLQKFNGWDRHTHRQRLQVSRFRQRKLKEEGAYFRPTSMAQSTCSPEGVVDIQRTIGGRHHDALTMSSRNRLLYPQVHLTLRWCGADGTLHLHRGAYGYRQAYFS